MKGITHKTKRTRFFSAAAALALCFQTMPSPVLAAGESEHLYSVETQRIEDIYDLPEQFPADEEETSVQLRTAASVRALIQFTDEPLASKIDLETFDPGSPEVLELRAEIARVQDKRIAQIEQQVLKGKTLDVRVRLDLAMNAISVQASPSVLSRIAALDFVKSVDEEKSVHPLNVQSDASITQMQIGGANEAASGIGSIPEGYDGQGSRIAILDTGLRLDHQSFDNGSFLKSLSDKAAAASQSEEAYKNRLDLLEESDIEQLKDSLHLKTEDSGLSASSLHYSDKVPFIYNYADGGVRVDHSDGQGDHGTHVAGIAAANTLVPSGSEYQQSTTMSGYAPDAQILVMKVFGSTSYGAESDLFAAMEDAVTLGCDAINLSLASDDAGNASPNTETFREFLESLSGFHAVITCSSSNSGSWPDETHLDGKLKNGDVSFQTSGTPGTYSQTLSIASSDPATFAAPSDSSAHELSGRMDISDFSSWGVTDALELKPEITAPGSNIQSSNGTSTNRYDVRSGTSMAAPAAAGMSAVLSSYIEEQNLVEQTGYNARFLMHSLLMSTAVPLKDADGAYYPVFAQGAGEARIDRALSARLILEMSENATVQAADGKIKAELKDDPTREGSYSFGVMFTPIDETQYVTFEKHLFTQEVDENGNLLKTTRELDVEEDSGDGKIYSIPAGKKTLHTFHIDLTDAEKARLDADTPKGAYIEGYINVRVCEISDGTGCYKDGEVSYTIPILGYYGDWNEPDVFEDISLFSSAKDNTQRSYVLEKSEDGRYHTNMLKVASRSDDSDSQPARYLAGNPYLIDEEDDLERSAISSDQTLSSLTISTVRTPEYLLAGVEDANGDVISYDSTIYSRGYAGKPYITKTSLAVTWHNVTHTVSFNQKDFTDGLSADKRYTFTAFAPTAYSNVSGFKGLDELIKSGNFPQSSRLSFPFVIDDEEPTLLSVQARNHALEIRSEDNQHTAIAALLSADGSQILASAIPEQEDQAGAAGSALLELDDFEAGEYILVLGDYARNESAYRLTMREQVSLIWTLEHMSVLADSSSENGDASYTLVCDDNYILPETISLSSTAGNVQASEYVYTPSDDGRQARLVLKASLLARGGTLTIRASASEKRTQMNFALVGDQLTLSAHQVALPLTSSSYTLRLIPDRGTTAPESVRIERDGRPLDATNYTYRAQTGEIVFASAAFDTGSGMTIYADAVRPKQPITLTCAIDEIEADAAALYTWTDASIQLRKVGASLLYPQRISIRNGDTLLAAQDYTYSASTGQIQISAGALLETTLVISGEAGHDVQPMQFVNALAGSSARFAAPQTWTNWTVTFTPIPWTDLPESVQVYIDGTLLSSSAYEWNPSSGLLELPAANMRGQNIRVEGSVRTRAMSYTGELEHLSFTATPSSWMTHTSYELQLQADQGFLLPEQISVLVDGNPLDEGCSWDARSGVLQIDADAMQGASLLIRGQALADTSEMNARFDLDEHITMEPQTPVVYKNTELLLHFRADADFHLPAGLTIQVDETLCRSYSWNPETGELRVPAEELRGSSFVLRLHAVADGASEIIADPSMKGTLLMTADPVNGEAFRFEIRPDSGYLLPDSISLFYGEEQRELQADEEYSYDAQTGQVVISASVLDGAQILVRASLPKEADLSLLRLVIETIEELNPASYSGMAQELQNEADQAKALLDVRGDQKEITDAAANLNAKLLRLRLQSSKAALNELPAMQ